jgi:hypothetical protein
MLSVGDDLGVLYECEQKSEILAALPQLKFFQVSSEEKSVSP